MVLKNRNFFFPKKNFRTGILKHLSDQGEKSVLEGSVLRGHQGVDPHFTMAL